MTGLATFIRRLRGLSLVERWNFHYRITRENVAEHSYWVATYAMILATLYNENHPTSPLDMGDVLKIALLHDAEEAVTGDCPMLVKRRVKDSWSVMEEEAATELQPLRELRILNGPYDHGRASHMLVKAADLLDVVMYAEHERKHGNMQFDQIQAEAIQALRSMQVPEATHLLEQLVGHRQGAAPWVRLSHL